MAGGHARLVVLDRDGVINEDSGEFIKSVTEWRPIRGSLEAIAALTRGGYRVAVVTNQSGIGRGLFSESVLATIHLHMTAAVREAGGELHAGQLRDVFGIGRVTAPLPGEAVNGVVVQVQ